MELEPRVRTSYRKKCIPVQCRMRGMGQRQKKFEGFSGVLTW